MPITTCTYVSPDEPICIDDAAPLVADWVGVGQSQHVQNLTTAVSVGQYRFVNRVTGTRRAATANGSLGGTSFGSSTYAVLASFSSGSLDIRFGAH